MKLKIKETIEIERKASREESFAIAISNLKPKCSFYLRKEAEKILESIGYIDDSFYNEYNEDGSVLMIIKTKSTEVYDAGVLDIAMFTYSLTKSRHEDIYEILMENNYKLTCFNCTNKYRVTQEEFEEYCKTHEFIIEE